MTKQEMADIAAIVSTAAEVDEVPENMVYLAMGCDLQRCEAAVALCVGAGFVKKLSGNRLRITEKGREIAKQLCEAGASS